ncbi:alpha/beta hydrolase [Bernardetia sp.]|uniref:alpha/beta hydrolase n=1 Tax=Bernardetia sp. TaxID=1937974 RepID=UPI0025BD0D00|nr:alpha/beta hydrolase [Bernardetia sp.]
MKKSYLVYLFIFLFFFVSCKDNSETLDENVVFEEEKELLDVAYGDDAQQKYDIYLPSNRSASKTKVIVLVHGGAWIGGDKADMKGVYDVLKITSSEYALVNINYRLATFNLQPFPMQIYDIKSVVEDLKSKSREYGILNEYAFVGVSAGAHLSMLYSYKDDTEKRVKAVVDVVGPTDFLHSSYTDSPNIETQQAALGLQLVIGKFIENDPNYFESISPRYAVTASSPPTIMFYGGVDVLAPFQQGEVLKQTLDSFGVTNEYYFYPNAEHDLGDENIADALAKSTTFIHTHLK